MVLWLSCLKSRMFWFLVMMRKEADVVTLSNIGIRWICIKQQIRLHSVLRFSKSPLVTPSGTQCWVVNFSRGRNKAGKCGCSFLDLCLCQPIFSISLSNTNPISFVFRPASSHTIFLLTRVCLSLLFQNRLIRFWSCLSDRQWLQLVVTTLGQRSLRKRKNTHPRKTFHQLARRIMSQLQPSSRLQPPVASANVLLPSLTSSLPFHLQPWRHKDSSALPEGKMPLLRRRAWGRVFCPLGQPLLPHLLSRRNQLYTRLLQI